MQPKPTICHIGYPKAASTTLQHHLFTEHPAINYLSFKTPKEKQNNFHTEQAKIGDCFLILNKNFTLNISSLASTST